MDFSTLSNTLATKLDHLLHRNKLTQLSTVDTILYALPFILIPNLAGALGAVVNRPALRTWYNNLRKPWFTPPNWVFGIVWPILYALIGTAAFLVWRDAGGFLSRFGQKPLLLFGLNILLNAAWSPVFFGLGNLKLAYLLHIGIYITAWMTWFEFRKVNSTAAILYAPYLIWLTYAGILQLWMFFYTKPPTPAELRATSSTKRGGPNVIARNNSTTKNSAANNSSPKVARQPSSSANQSFQTVTRRTTTTNNA